MIASDVDTISSDRLKPIPHLIFFLQVAELVGLVHMYAVFHTCKPNI